MARVECKFKCDTKNTRICAMHCSRELSIELLWTEILKRVGYHDEEKNGKIFNALSSSSSYKNEKKRREHDRMHV